MESTTPALPPLLYAETAHSADLLYFGQFSVPDPIIAFGTPAGKKIAVVNALEFGRARRDSAFDTVLPQETWLEKARARWTDKTVGAAEIITLLAEEYQIPAFAIPETFPAGLCDRVRALGVRLTPVHPLFPAREVKTRAELAALREGNRCSALGLAAAEKLLRASRIRDGQLLLKGEPLTSERLRFAIEVACLEAGALSLDTIVAGGDQACDPHERGHGPLRAHELIIIDIFPRVSASGYHGDMTRTFLRGQASEAQHALVGAVRAAQLAALSILRAGINGRHVHQACLDTFAARGYETKRGPRGAVGFFHGTGHGLGLQVHEAPRVSTTDHVLQKNSVVTVEPGLYYPGLGACRIEDVAQVTATRPRLLSEYPYEWELR